MNEVDKTAQDIVETVEDLARELLRRLYLLLGTKNQTDISYSQYKAMSVIYHAGSISIGNLEQLVGSAQSTTSEMVARLTKAGLVSKFRGPMDGRVVKVKLTEAGAELLEKKRDRVRKGYQALFEKLSSEQQRKFLSSIGTLNSILQQRTG